MHMFSRARERFISIDEETINELEAEARSGYMSSSSEQLMNEYQ